MPKIRRNRLQCPNCNEVIESRFRHDWNECKCGDIFVDGGLDYVRYGFKNEQPILLTEFVGDPTDGNGNEARTDHGPA